MGNLSRRLFVTGALASGVTACGNGVGSNGALRIDARVDQALSTLHSQYPSTLELKEKSAGMLVMPLVTKAGLGLGGAFGRGALRVNDSTVDYYSSTAGSVGLQIGFQQFSHVLYFTTQEALADFRSASGWSAGADLEYAFKEKGANAGIATTTMLSPVIAVTFAQAGVQAGISLKGTKYRRILP